MFKIGNSKDLPAIPDHLSDEGKDFIRQCLQREPSRRPAAAELLQHPFVRNAAPLEKSILGFDPLEQPIAISSGLKSKVIVSSTTHEYLPSKLHTYTHDCRVMQYFLN